MFYFDNIKGKKILKSDLIENGVFFTTKESFIRSQEPNTQNLTENNKNLICEYLNIFQKNLISPVQTHSTNIEIVKENKFNYPETDALILTNKKQAIFLNFADCTPIIIYDKKQNIGAIAHAGWRGTAGKISQLTAQKMIEEFNSKQENIVALIGPTISMCCYNVGEDVFSKLKSTVKNFDKLYLAKDKQIYVDLKNINRTQLEEIGIKNIDVCPYCTSCNNEFFFSYRKENGITSRHSAVLKLF